MSELCTGIFRRGICAAGNSGEYQDLHTGIHFPIRTVPVNIVLHVGWNCVCPYAQLCQLNATDNMLCEMPVLNLPTEFTFTNDTRREGTAVSTLRTPHATLNMYIGFTLDNLPTFKNLSKARPGISFTLIPLQVSFAPAGDTPVEFDPSVNKYLFIKVCDSNALLVINNLCQSGYVCASVSGFVLWLICQQERSTVKLWMNV